MKQIDFKRLKVLFNAVNAEFPPILAPDFKVILSYQRYSNIYKYEKQVVKNNSTKGIYICSDNLMLIFKGDNIFKCENGTFISQHYVCDGIIDCPGHEPLDEMGCQYFSDTKTNYSGMCKWLTHPTSKKIICSGFYFQSEDGTCTSHQFNQFTRNINSNKDLASAFIQCADGRIIPKDSVDHLPVYCQQENMDELDLITMI